MLPLLLALQLAATDTVYATPALRDLIASAATRNRRVPAGLSSYRARLESEISLVGGRPDGLEGAVSLEQVENELRWRRTGEAEQRVVGYRAQTLGPQLSVLGFFRQSWVVPVLYGNRIGLFFGRDTSRRASRPPRSRRAARRATTFAVHPLADDRERVYRYAGGDTITTLRVEGRDIPIVRVMV